MFVSYNPKQKPSVRYAVRAVYMQRAYRLRWLKRWGHRIESRSRHDCVRIAPSFDPLQEQDLQRTEPSREIKHTE